MVAFPLFKDTNLGGRDFFAHAPLQRLTGGLVEDKERNLKLMSGKVGARSSLSYFFFYFRQLIFDLNEALKSTMPRLLKIQRHSEITTLSFSVSFPNTLSFHTEM